MSIEAAELWIQPDSVATHVYGPVDLKMSSDSVMWVADGLLRGIFRLSPPTGQYGFFGIITNGPPEVVHPVRLAVAEDVGVFAFDDSTRRVDLYTPGGKMLRGFQPGFRPSIMELGRRPFRLTFGIVQSGTLDSVPGLIVVQTDLMGQKPDTILSARSGPSTLRSIRLRAGETSSAPTQTGLWIWPGSATDTVFEVTRLQGGRKLVLPPEDSAGAGILSDVSEEILWTVSGSDAAGFRYRAYDVSNPSVIDGQQAFLGERTTPPAFTPRAALGGSVFGLRRRGSQWYLAAAYDMRVDDLRRHAAP